VRILSNIHFKSELLIFSSRPQIFESGCVLKSEIGSSKRKFITLQKNRARNKSKVVQVGNALRKIGMINLA